MTKRNAIAASVVEGVRYKRCGGRIAEMPSASHVVAFITEVEVMGLPLGRSPDCRQRQTLG